VRIEHNDDGSIDVFVRQSWIGDAVMCAERGRNGIVRPEWNTSNDLTVLGTGVHAGIAHDLEADRDGQGRMSMADMIESAEQAIDHEIATTTMRWVRNDRSQMSEYVPKLLEQYVRGLRPLVVGQVAEVEWGFNFLLDEFDHNGVAVRVHGKGTADLLTTGPVPVWDWKTSGQPYKQHEKQKTAAQPTMYAAAAVAAGLAEWPVRFNYGVMVRDRDFQVVPVVRSENHLRWLQMTVRPFITLALGVGVDTPWPRVDTGFLCSENWCSYWSVCKGAAISSQDQKPTKEMLV
jgi:hypothetical protein